MADEPENTDAPETEADDGPDPSTMSEEQQTEYYRKLAVRGKEKAEKAQPKPPPADEGKGSAADKDGNEPEKEKAKEPEKKPAKEKADAKEGEKVDDDKGKSKSVDDKKGDQDSGKKADAKEGEKGKDGDDGEKPDTSKPPQNIPKAVKEAWDKIPEEARADIAKTHLDANMTKMKLGREEAKAKAAAEKAAPALAFLKDITESTPGVEDFIKEHGTEKFAAAVSSALRMDAEYASDPIKVVFQLANAAGVLGDFKEALKELDVKPSGKGTKLGMQDDGGAGEDPRDAEIRKLKSEVKSLQGRDFQAESKAASHRDAYHKALDHAEANSSHEWDAETRQAVADNLVKAAKADPSASEAEHVRRAINAVAEYHPTLEKIAPPPDASSADAAEKAAKAAAAADSNVNPAGAGPASDTEADLSENEQIQAIVEKYHPGHKVNFRD